VAETDIPAEVIAFLADNIDSVLELELLLLVRADAARSWTGDALAAELRIDPAFAAEQLTKFHQRGLLARTSAAVGAAVGAAVAAPPSYRYAPQTPALDTAVGAVASAYATHRVTIIGLIFSKPTSTLKTFADAFRIRGTGGAGKERPDNG
jgi:hypothetical protein